MQHECENRTHDGERRYSAAHKGVFDTGGEITRRVRENLGSVREPARDIPVFATTDVLVVGGGPAGTTAAIAAARLGADVILAERYNHLGGLATGGLVIWIDRMTDWQGDLLIRGLGEELLDRLPRTRFSARPGSNGDRATSSWRTNGRAGTAPFTAPSPGPR